MATWHSQPFASPRECTLPRAAATASAGRAGPRSLSTRTRAISSSQSSSFHGNPVGSWRRSSSGGGSSSSSRNSISGIGFSRTGDRRRQNAQRCSARGATRVVRCAASESESGSADGDGGAVGTATATTTSTAAVRPSIGSGTEGSAVKLKILALVAGLDRGVAASQADTRRVEEAVSALELSASPMQPFGTTTTSSSSSSSSSSLQALDGSWRLVYSSGFAAGSLGGLRPGPPTGRLPITVGQVLQRIDVGKRELDNIVELKLGVTPWPLPAVEVTATLAHSFETFGAAGIRIIFERTSVKVGGVDSQLPGLSTPQLPDFLQPPRDTRSGEFETTYLDDDFRVSRGDRGELRVFVRAA